MAEPSAAIKDAIEASKANNATAMLRENEEAKVSFSDEEEKNNSCCKGDDTSVEADRGNQGYVRGGPGQQCYRDAWGNEEAEVNPAEEEKTTTGATRATNKVPKPIAATKTRRGRRGKGKPEGR